MSKPGRFMLKKFRGKQIEIWTSNESEYIHYADSDSFSWCIITGEMVDYDTEDGIITLKSTVSGQHFYISENTVEMFWEKGFNIRECSKASVRDLKNGRNRDIM